MYGMSAKDRMAMFENKSAAPKKNQGPKKIGKLNIGNKKATEEPKKTVPPKKAKAEPAKQTKTNENDKENKIIKPTDKAEVTDSKQKIEQEKKVKQEESKETPKQDLKPQGKTTSTQEKNTPKQNDVNKVELKPKDDVPATKDKAKDVQVKDKPKELPSKDDNIQPKEEVQVKEKPIEEVPAKKEEKQPNKDVQVAEKAKEAASAKKEEKQPEKSVQVNERPKEEAPTNKEDVQVKNEVQVKEKPKEEASTKKEDVQVEKEVLVKVKPKEEAHSREEHVQSKEEVQVKEKPKEEAPAKKDVQLKQEVQVKEKPKEEIQMKVIPKDIPPPKTEQQKTPTQKVTQPQEKTKDTKVTAKEVTEKPKENESAQKVPQQPQNKPKEKVIPENDVQIENKSKADTQATNKEPLEHVPVSAPEPKKRKPAQYKPVPEEFYDTLFYFSGMGTVVGSALNEGVYVPQRATKTALGTDVIEQVEEDKDKEREQDTFMIRTARTQASNIADELRKLQLLLGGLPSFGAQNTELQKIEQKPFDTIMHAKYHTIQIEQPHEKRSEVKISHEKPQSQWPPPIVAPKETPILTESRPVAHTKAEGPGNKEKNVGVFKGMVNGPAEHPPSTKLAPIKNQPAKGGARPYGVHTAIAPEKSQPWQEKYGSKSVEDVRGPQPFHPEGEIPSGLKPWELSRLRGLEARGFQFSHLEPKSGADYSDSFYHGSASLELENVNLGSLAPYLVSGRSQSVDREQKLSEAQPPILSSTYSLQAHKGYGSQGESLPYCDL